MTESYREARAYGRGYGTRTRKPSRYQYPTAPYNYGSEAPELYPEVPSRRRSSAPARRRAASVRDEEELRRNREIIARNRERQKGMSPVIIMLFVTAFVIIGVICAQYLSVQSQLTSAISEVASKQTQLQTLKASNDETLNEIEASINLDEIKYKAITELGMSYAQDDQIITYSNDDSDYVHQVTEVGN